MLRALAAMNVADSQDNAWLPDTRAAANITPYLGKLHTKARYFGPEKIIIGNGDALDITHVVIAYVGRDQLKLNKILVVPAIKKNLLFVSQPTTEYSYLFEFTSYGFVIKHRGTGTVITYGTRFGDLCAMPVPHKHAFFSTRF